MLSRKMFREMKSDFGQFFSLFLLSFLAVSLFATFKASNTGAYKAMKKFHAECHLADGWLYGEGFTQDHLEAVRGLSQVNEAQLRIHVTGNSVEQGNAQIEIYLMEESIVNKPYVIKGREFDPTDTQSLWLSEKFADEWNLKLGDEFAYEYNGVTVKKTIAGFIAAPEYEYMCADEDLDVDFKNIAYVYMSYHGFPTREYITKLVENGDITVGDILKSKSIPEEILEKTGVDENLLSGNEHEENEIRAGQDRLLKLFDYLSDETLTKIMPYTELVFTTDVKDVLSLEEELSKALEGDYAVLIDRSSITGLKILRDELNQHHQFSYGFTFVFLAIALLVIMTTMNRMVAAQRTQIGTMNAMGMKRRKIKLHYISYSFVVSAVGAVTGLIVGTFGLGKILVNIFSTFYIVPNWKPAYNMSFIIVAIVVVIVCTLTSYLSCRRLLKVNPADCLRAAPPKAGKRCIFEKLPFWNQLGFYSQYNLRDISRAKLRAFMGIFGTACGMMLMICGFACNTTLDNLYEWTFEKLQNYKYDMQFSDNITVAQAEEISKEIGGELVMIGSVEVAKKEHALSDEKKTTMIAITEGLGYYGITNVKQEVVSIEPGTIAISSKLAKNLEISVGDTIYWHIYDKNEWYSAKVGVLSRNPTVSGITMLREDFLKTGNKYKPTMFYTNEDIIGYEKEHEEVSATHSSREIREAYETNMEMMYVMVAVFMIFATVMPVVVLYNCGNLSFNERMKELATLKVLGFRSGKIRKLLSIQNLWLSVIGVLAGAPFGRILLQYMFDSNGDSYDYLAVVAVRDYVISGVLVLTVSVLVSFMFSKRIKRLDMVEVLKGME